MKKSSKDVFGCERCEENVLELGSCGQEAVNVLNSAGDKLLPTRPHGQVGQPTEGDAYALARHPLAVVDHARSGAAQLLGEFAGNQVDANPGVEDEAALVFSLRHGHREEVTLDETVVLPGRYLMGFACVGEACLASGR